MLKGDGREHIAEALVSKTWAELEVLEHADRLYFPHTMRQRRADGNWKELRCRIRVPRSLDMETIRLDARKLATEREVDPEIDPDKFVNLESLCELFFALREWAPPHEPIAMSPVDLGSRWDMPVLEDALKMIEHWRVALDPQPNTLEREELLAVIAAITEERDIRPLLVFDGRSQNDCIVGMADLCTTLMGQLSLSEQSARSTPVTSPGTSSSES